jgi:hypothetical protein
VPLRTTRSRAAADLGEGLVTPRALSSASTENGAAHPPTAKSAASGGASRHDSPALVMERATLAAVPASSKESPVSERLKVIFDGNEAAASVAHRASEVDYGCERGSMRIETSYLRGPWAR